MGALRELKLKELLRKPESDDAAGLRELRRSGGSSQKAQRGAHRSTTAPGLCGTQDREGCCDVPQTAASTAQPGSSILDGTGSPAELLNSMQHSSAEAQPNPRPRGGGK